MTLSLNFKSVGELKAFTNRLNDLQDPVALGLSINLSIAYTEHNPFIVSELNGPEALDLILGNNTKPTAE